MKQKLPLSVFPSPVAFKISFASTTLLKAGYIRELEQGGKLISSLWMLICVCMCVILVYYIYNISKLCIISIVLVISRRENVLAIFHI